MNYTHSNLRDINNVLHPKGPAITPPRKSGLMNLALFCNHV